MEHFGKWNELNEKRDEDEEASGKPVPYTKNNKIHTKYVLAIKPFSVNMSTSKTKRNRRKKKCVPS